MRFANVTPKIAALSYDLADVVARSDIECCCHRQGLDWYDTTAVMVLDLGYVRDALAYLDARGLINHHPEQHALVNFEGIEF